MKPKKPKKPVKDYLGSGRKKTQFLNPPPPKRKKPGEFYGFAPEGEKGWMPQKPKPVPAKKRSTKKATVRRKKK